MDSTTKGSCSEGVSGPNVPSNALLQPDSDMATQLSHAAVLSLTRFQKIGSLLHLQGALLFAEEAVKLTPANHPALANRLSNLGMMLQTKHAWTKKARDLDNAIDRLTQAVEAASKDDLYLSSMLSNLSSALGKRFEQMKRMNDLEEAIRKARQAVEISPIGSPHLGKTLSVLGGLLEKRHVCSQNTQDLEQAIRITTQAVQAIHPGNFDQPACLMQLSRLFQRRFKLTAEIKDLDEAVCRTEAALKMIPKGHPGLATTINQLGAIFQEMSLLTDVTIDIERYVSKLEGAMTMAETVPSALAPTLHNLAQMLEKQYQRTTKIEDLERGICKMEQAVKVASADHAGRTSALQYLAHLLKVLFQRTGKTEHLDHAIANLKQALLLAPASRTDSVSILSDMATILHLRFEKLGSMADIDEAIIKAEQVVRATTAGVELVWPLNNLGCFLESRFLRKGNFEDLGNAIQKTKQAIALIPAQHPDRAAMLNNLGSMLGDRFTRTKNIEDIEEAILNTNQAVIRTAVDDPNLGRRLNALGMLFIRRYSSTGRMECLEEAILRLEQSVDLAGISQTEKSWMLGNLGGALKERYLRSERLQDLEDAINRTQQGIEIIPDDHSAKAGMLHSLGSMFERRCWRTDDIKDLEDAVDSARQAVEASLNDHADLVHMLNNLGSILTTRFERLGHQKDLYEAISKMEQALKAMPVGQLGQTMVWYNLGSALERLFLLTENVEHLERAIVITEQAVEATPAESPELANYLNQLGSLHALSASSPDNERTLHSFLRSWDCQNGALHVRVNSARQAIRLLEKEESWDRAHSLAEQALGLIPSINSRLMSREDQQHAIKDFAGLASHACSLSLQVGMGAIQALELAELGRGVIVGNLIEDRSDVSELQKSYSKKVLKYERIRAELNKPVQEISGSIASQDTKQRKALVQELEDCVRDIRQLPGFERFLLGPTSSEMMELASEGPIIVVNVTSFRSDAIIVSNSSIRAIRLHALTFEQAEVWISKDLTRVSSPKERVEKNKTYRDFLVWLWSVCVGPVLEEIGIVEESLAQKTPRIWWIGVGIAGSLPFHAAGEHSLDSTENILSRAICSYTPTIRALRYARERARTRYRDEKLKLLVVTMPTTQGVEKCLPGAKEEGSQIKLVCESGLSVQLSPLPSADLVLNSLMDHDIAHFACHGFSDAANPSNSCLLLQKPDAFGSSETPDKLTVWQISQMKLERSKLAYLSACSTAENRSAILSDEVIHIASGFQVAGFRHVVGCMWPSDDQVSIEVAKLFYQQLMIGYQNQDQDHDWIIAAALRYSLTQVRAIWRKLPLSWAQYIHLGA